MLGVRREEGGRGVEQAEKLTHLWIGDVSCLSDCFVTQQTANGHWHFHSTLCEVLRTALVHRCVLSFEIDIQSSGLSFRIQCKHLKQKEFVLSSVQHNRKILIRVRHIF